MQLSTTLGAVFRGAAALGIDGVDSLNVAAAVAVAFWELGREDTAD